MEQTVNDSRELKGAAEVEVESPLAPGASSIKTYPATMSAYEDLFEDEGDVEDKGSEAAAFKVLRDDVKSMSAMVKSAENRLGAIETRISELGAELGRLRTDEQILTELQARYQELSEGFYEREVLIPVALALIGIADRCMQGSEKAAELAKSEAAAKNQSAFRALRHIQQAREADRVEIVNQLANFGVETFQIPDDVFDPTCQSCVSRVPNIDTNVHGRIANRISPGYRRNGRIIRHECVAVYVTVDTNNGNLKGGQS